MLAGGCGDGVSSGLTAGEQGRVVRIQDGDVLALDTGLRVRLTEIEAPRIGYRDREGDLYGEDAKRALEDVALGRDCRLYYGGLTRDRYDRALAHVIVADELGGGVWANGYMIRQGGARVRTWPDNAARAAELLAFEREARSLGRGLWAYPDYAPRRPDQMAELAGGFALIEGRAEEVEESGFEDGDAVAAGEGFRLRLGARLIRHGRASLLKAGDGVRIRGRVLTRDGPPRIPLTHWAQIERL